MKTLFKTFNTNKKEKAFSGIKQNSRFTGYLFSPSPVAECNVQHRFFIFYSKRG